MIQKSEDQQHYPPTELEAIRAETVERDFEERLRLVTHLAEGCSSCWEALDGLPPPPDDLLPQRPLGMALLRVRQRHFPLLSSEHEAALKGVRDRRFGFAFLLLEEAMRHREDMDLARAVAAQIHGSHARERAAHDLMARTHAYFAAWQCAHAKEAEAVEAIEIAARHAALGTSDASIHADVELARLFLALIRLDDGAAYAHVEQVLQDLDVNDHALRRFEVFTVLLSLAGLASSDEGSPFQASEMAFREPEGPGNGEDPAKPASARRPPGPVLSRVFLSLAPGSSHDAVLDLIHAAGFDDRQGQPNFYFQGLFCRWAARFHTALDSERAATAYHRSLEAWTAHGNAPRFAETLKEGMARLAEPEGLRQREAERFLAALERYVEKHGSKETGELVARKRAELDARGVS